MISPTTAPLCEKSYPPGVKWKMEAAAHPLFHFMDAAAAQHADRPALSFMGRELTYKTVHAQVQALAAALQNLGVKKGDRVGICLPNCPAAVIAYYAILTAGGVVVNMNPLYTANELENVITDSGARLVITANLAVILPKLLPVLGTHLQHLVMVDFTRQLPWHLGLLFGLFKSAQLSKPKPQPNLHMFDELVAKGATPTPVKIDATTDLAVLQYTGGTTGIPKGAMLTHAALASNVTQLVQWLGPPPQQHSFLAILPLFHCFAMTVAMNLALPYGAKIVLLPQFNLKQVLAAIRRHRITILPGVPTLFNAIINAPALRSKHFASVQYGVSGGAPLPAEIKERFDALTGCRLMEGYGLTEASPVAACNPRHLPNKTGSVGVPLPGTTVEIRAAETGEPMPQGEVGEIWIHGPQLMRGYWNNEAATRDVLVNGWLRTGDLGFLDNEGYLHLTDRIKDIIIVNGYNIYPRVIEDALYRHPDVAEVMVIGVPHEKKGEAPKAYVVLKNGADVTADQLLKFAHGQLNPLERPLGVELRQQLPKTMVGKLSKKDLRAEVLGQ